MNRAERSRSGVVLWKQRLILYLGIAKELLDRIKYDLMKCTFILVSVFPFIVVITMFFDPSLTEIERIGRTDTKIFSIGIVTFILGYGVSVAKTVLEFLRQHHRIEDENR